MLTSVNLELQSFILMKGLLFFAGSLLRWPPKKPKQFLYFHAYIIFIYGLTSIFNGSGFVFTAGMLAPLFFAIYQGLPLDCLDYKSAISREFTTD